MVDQFCEHCGKRVIPMLDAEVIQSIQKNTPPICFHCGKYYKRDEPNSSLDSTVWKPVCNCVGKSTIRIVTGTKIVIEDEDGNEIDRTFSSNL